MKNYALIFEAYEYTPLVKQCHDIDFKSAKYNNIFSIIT